MASQWSRLRNHHQWIRKVSEQTTQLEGASASWLRAAGVLGGVASSAWILSESSSILSEHSSIDGNVDKKNNPSTQEVPTKEWVPPPLASTPVFPFQPQRCQCEAGLRDAGPLFARNTKIQRTKTMLSYEDEVCKETVRSRYKVLWKKPLGEGGFGAVYLATDRKSGEKVALKQISKKYTNDMGFQREMDAFMHLRRYGGHPNICGLRENFDEGNYFYFSLDLISGGEMFDHLIRSGPYSEEDAARHVRDVASALNFMHEIGFVHGDLKPENLMLSTENTSDAVIKLIDFGCAQVDTSQKATPGVVGLTTAYASPEMLAIPPGRRKRIDPPLDMWALGVILHIMLVGCHPFDLTGDAPDEDIATLVTLKETPPTLDIDSPLTEHLSDSAMDLIRRLLEWDPKKRITARQMLEHPWIKGETTRKEKITGSDKKLSKFRVFKSSLEAKVFEDIVSWADTAESDNSNAAQRTSLIERSFRKLDEEQKGFITAKDLKKLTGSPTTSLASKSTTSNEEEALSLSAFSNLLSENMQNKYFSKGKVVFKEGEEGNSMIFVNSGKLEIRTKDGFKMEVQAGSFVGEGALISPDRTRNATVVCLTPVHAIEVSREYFEKYLAASESLVLHMREKDKKRALNRTKNILRRQRELKPINLKRGETVFEYDEQSNEVYIIEDGNFDFVLEDHVLATTKAGEMFGAGSLITRQNRNCTAICASDTCRVHMMKAKEFFDFMDSSPILKSSVYDVFLRKEFTKAVAWKTKKKFPMSRKDLREVFDSIDTAGDGVLNLDELEELLLSMDKNAPKDVVKGIMNSLDIDSSGCVDFQEFCQIFGTEDAKQKR